jgi:Protein of unknown function (DUF2442)
MIDLVKVTSVKPKKNYDLLITFSNGAAGTFDFSTMLAEGGTMVEPLKDITYFHRVFIESGVLAWPNGFDIDAISLHSDMKSLGLLAKAA